MKKLLLCFFVITFCNACTKKNKSPLVGKWKLTHVLVDPGNGKGAFQKTNQEKVIEFFNDGTLKTNVSYCPLDNDKTIGMSGTYDMNHTQLIMACTSSESKINFEINDSKLIIDYPTQCMEPCKEKYTKID
ncbi:lipocalin family protein [Aquimarina macrocephali]|uniref:lipocalin family protein n=1 Tax=Aquimarina macrocephali TaxID=666563 RepID=UPI003F668B23